MKNYILAVISLFFFQVLSAQLLLDADGPGDTYELIASKLAPGYNPIEVPDCNHTIFGRHIDEIFDSELNEYVFRFHIHKLPDDDRCINFDRQRNEIKSYSQSPDSLKGIEGELFEYKWKFKLDSGFQSSPKFTHIHQLKAVGGSQSSHPVITLTTRSGSPDKLQLRHGETTSSVNLLELDLASFKGIWCEATATVLYGETGTYSLIIKKVSDNSTLLSYNNNNLRMWRTGAEFIRPKWGIYRSLVHIDSLRDEEVFFANFSITENPAIPLVVEIFSFSGTVLGQEVILNWQTSSEQNNKGFVVQKSVALNEWEEIGFVESNGNSNTFTYYNFVDEEPNIGLNYYRLKQIDFNNLFKFSNTIAMNFESPKRAFGIAPNPVGNILEIIGVSEDQDFEIFNSAGKIVLKGKTEQQQINLSGLSKAVYFLHLNLKEGRVAEQFMKK